MKLMFSQNEINFSQLTSDKAGLLWPLKIAGLTRNTGSRLCVRVQDSDYHNMHQKAYHCIESIKHLTTGFGKAIE